MFNTQKQEQPGKKMQTYNATSQMVNSGQNVQECDTTDDHSSTTARHIIFFLSYQHS
jgi:hypothetical protein